MTGEPEVMQAEEHQGLLAIAEAKMMQGRVLPWNLQREHSPADTGTEDF